MFSDSSLHWSRSTFANTSNVVELKSGVFVLIMFCARMTPHSPDFCLQDLDNLYNFLHQLDCCRHVSEVALRHWCKVARYESLDENSVVYK